MLWARWWSTWNEWRVADLSWSRLCNRNSGEYGSTRGESSCRLRQESLAGEVAFTRTDVGDNLQAIRLDRDSLQNERISQAFEYRPQRGQ
jgi:hypothetical protein